MFGAFTEFHRFFTEGELINNDEPQKIKDYHVGIIVISNGEIATDDKLQKDFDDK